MSYTAPTPLQFKASFPRFGAVNLDIIQNALTLAGRMVDESWTEGDYSRAIMLLAAHEMTLDGLGEGAEAQGFAKGTADFTVIKSGGLTLERAASAASNDQALTQTSFGRRFRELLKRNKPTMKALTE